MRKILIAFLTIVIPHIVLAQDDDPPIPSNPVEIGSLYYYLNLGDLEPFDPESSDSYPSEICIGTADVAGVVYDDPRSIDIPEKVYYVEYMDLNQEIYAEHGISLYYTVTGISSLSEGYNITSVSIPYSVTWIGKYAFCNCSSLTTIDIPYSVLSIGDYAFSGCSSLEDIYIPSSVTSIGKEVLANCPNLVSIQVDPDNTYYDSRFNCDAIIEKSSDRLIAGCQNTIIPNNVKKIGERAFSGCENLASIVIPPSIKHIESYAFENCYHLNEVTLCAFGSPFAMTESYEEFTVSNNAFSGIDLANVTLMYCGYEDEDVFNNEWNDWDNSLNFWKQFGTIVYLGKWGYQGIYYCVDVANWYFSGEGPDKATLLPYNNTMWDYDDNVYFYSGDIVIPQYVTFEPEPNPGSYSYSLAITMKNIGDAAFFGCEDMTSVILPYSVTNIGNDAFRYCTSLTSFFIPNSVTNIGNRAFKDCFNMAFITIPSSVTNIGDKAFENCASLTSVIVEHPIPITITQNVFPGRRNTTLYVPTGSKERYMAAEYWKDFKQIIEGDESIICFADSKVKALCVENWDANHDGELSQGEAAAVTSLGTVFKKTQITTFNELRYFTGLTCIGEGAFNASTVKSIILPENITALDAEAFLDCPSLMSINLPAKVSSLGLNALSGCTAMESITVDGQNEHFCNIGDVLFSKDKTVLIQYPAALGTRYNVPEGTTTIARDAFYKSKLWSIELPGTLKEIGYDAFGYCKNLSELAIPEGVTVIGDYILDHCTALGTLHIPSTVTNIGQRMANYCNAITKVFCNLKVPFDINVNNFTTKVYSNAKLYVPYETGEEYATAMGWKEFQNKIVINAYYAYLDCDDKETLTFFEDMDLYYLFNFHYIPGKDHYEYEPLCGVVISIDDNNEEVPFGTVDGWSIEEDVWDEIKGAITKVVFQSSFAGARPKSLSKWFSGMEKLKTVEGMENLNTSEVTDMKEMFRNCSSLKRADMEGFDTSKVTDFSQMFDGCTALASLDLSNFTLNGGAATTSMMLNCKAMKTLKLSADMAAIDTGACQGVGTSTAPCILFTPEGFNFGTNTSGTFLWKSGYFRSTDEPEMYVSETRFVSGQTKEVAVNLKNGSETYLGFQFDFTPPEGFSFEFDDNEKAVYTLGSRCTGNFTTSMNLVGERTYRVMVYTTSGGYISGSDGPVFTFSLKADDDLPIGTWEGALDNVFVNIPGDIGVKCLDSKFNLIICSESYLNGDVNHDCFINILDVTTVINYILNKMPSPFYIDEADANADGWVNMADVTRIINIILGNVSAAVPAHTPTSMLDGMFIGKSADGYVLFLDNTDDYTACEFTLQLPEGCTLAGAFMDDGRTDAHRVMTKALGDGLYRVAVYSSANATLGKGSSAMVHLTVNGENGDNVGLSNILFVRLQQSCVRFPDVEGVATGIEGVFTDTDNTPTYNPQGIPVKKTTRGVHVKGGGKYVVK